MNVLSSRFGRFIPKDRPIYVFCKRLSGSESHFGRIQLVFFFYWLLQGSSRGMMRRIQACCAVKLAMLGERSEKHPVVIKTKIPFFVSSQDYAMARHFAG